MTKRFLFACVANSFRSQLAEAWARHLADLARAEIRSGGTVPSGVVHPRVAKLMAERGVDTAEQRSKAIDLDFAARADAFVTLCGPLDDACPAPLAERAIDWSMPDPTWGTVEEMRGVRDEIGRRVHRLLGEHGVLRKDAPLPP